MRLKDIWWSIEDWAEANGIDLETALEQGISHNDDDTIDIPESYSGPFIPAENYYGYVDVEMYVSHDGSEEGAYQIKKFREDILDQDSHIRNSWEGEFSEIQIDNLRTDTDGIIHIMYLRFIPNRQWDFAQETSRNFPNLYFVVEASDIDNNYACEDEFENGQWIINSEGTYAEKFPDIYREHQEDLARELAEETA